MADPVNYNRPGVSAQEQAAATKRYSQMIADSRRQIAAADTQGASASDAYRASLQRAVTGEGEMAQVTGEGTAAIEARTAAVRQATAALGEYQVVASRSGRSFAVTRDGDPVVGGFRTADTAARRAAALRQAEAATIGLSGGGAGGGGGLPPVAAAGAGGAAGGGQGAAKGYNTILAEQAQREALLAQAERELMIVRSANGAELASLSTDTRRYGALTSEFFEAAARGEVTVRELGYQVGITAAKFGGWTAAATAIFGVIGALREVSKGAIDAASGVSTLQRFVPNVNRDQAIQGYVSVSQQLIEPIGQVAEAQSAFAKVTHDQTNSLQAARLAILATKLDNIQLADSYRYLIAIVQEGGYSWKQLPGIFDQISGAQRNMGARVAETLPALAKSIGAVTSQGGDINQLLALIATAQITTGQTGNVIGTAMARGAANFYNTTASRAVEQAFGVNTSLGFTQRLVEAVQVGTNLDPQQRLELSHAFFGPLRGGLLAGLFRQGSQLDRGLNVTSPGYTAGSTMQEWKDQSQRLDYQFQRLVVGAQDFGAELLKVGALRPFGLLLEATNGLISGGVRLLQVFGELPSPLRTAAEAAGGLAAAVFALQRFSGGQWLRAVPVLRTLYNPAFQDQRLLGQGLRQNVEGSRVAAIGAAQTAEIAGVRAQSATVVYQQREANLKQLQAMRAQLTDAEAIRQADIEIAAANEAAADASRQAVVASRAAAEADRQVALQKQVYAINALEQQTVARMSPVEAQAYGRSRGYFAVGHIGAPTSDPAVLMSSMGLSEQEAVAMQTRVIGLQRAAGALDSAGRSASLGARAAGLANRGMESMATGLSRIAGAAAALGPLDIALIAMIAIPAGIGEINSDLTNLHNAVAKITPPDTTNFHRDVRTIDKQLRHLRDIQTEASQPPSGFFQNLLSGGATSADWIATNVLGVSAPFDYAKKRAKAAQDAAAKIAIDEAIRPYSQLAANTQDQVKSAKTVQDQVKAYQTGLDRLATFAQGILGIKSPTTPGAAQAAQARVTQYTAEWQAAITALHASGERVSSTLQALGDLDPQHIANLGSHVTDYVGLYGVDKTSRGMASEVILRARASVAAVPAGQRWKAMHDALGAISAAENAIIQQAQTDFETAVRNAGKDQGKIRAARTTYLRNIRFNIAPLQAAIKAIEADERSQNVRLQNAERSLAEISKELDVVISEAFRNLLQHINNLLGLGKINTAQSEALAAARNSVNVIRQSLKQDQNQRQQYIDQLNQENRQIGDLTAQANQTTNAALKKAKTPSTPKSEDAFSMAQLRGELQAAIDAYDPVAVAADHVAAAEQERRMARDQRERIQAQIDLLQAEQEYNNAVQDVSQSRFDYLKSLTTDPVKQAAIDVQKAANAVAFDAGHGGLDTSKGYQDRGALNDARQKYADANITAREDTIEFRLKMNEISSQTAIQEYEALLHIHGITKQLRRQVLERIQELKNAGQNDFAALDLGSIRLPTPYEIRRSIQAIRDQGAASAVYQSNQMDIHVYNAQDAATVGVQVDRFMGGTGKALARAAGTR